MKIVSLIIALVALGFSQLCWADSSSIRQSIVNELEQRSDLGKHNITIDVRRNIVTLQGQVTSEYDSALIEQVANNTSGVKDVKNYILVSTIGLDDTKAIAKDIRDRVRANKELQDYHLKVAMTGATATLSGEVANADDVKRIEEVALSTPGVKEVNNELLVRPLPSDNEIEKRVLRALANDGGINTEDLTVVSKSGKVTIGGSLTNHRDIDRILSVALMVDGVRDIHNEMTINHETYRARIKDSEMR